MATDARVSQAPLLVLVQENPSAKVSQAALLALVQETPAARVSQVALLVLQPTAVTHDISGSALLAFSASGALTRIQSLSGSVAMAFEASGSLRTIHGFSGEATAAFSATGHLVRTAAPLDHTPPYNTEECGALLLTEESGPFLLTEETGPITVTEPCGAIVATEETGRLLLTEGKRDMRFIIIRGSVLPAFEVTWRKADKTARDLTDATAARLVVSDAYETASGSLDLNVDLDFVSPKTSGQLLYEWQDGDTDIAAGTYKAQVEADFPDGTAKIELEFVVRSQVKVPA